jgi:hypothetical protein
VQQPSERADLAITSSPGKAARANRSAKAGNRQKVLGERLPARFVGVFQAVSVVDHPPPSVSGLLHRSHVGASRFYKRLAANCNYPLERQKAEGRRQK